MFPFSLSYAQATPTQRQQALQSTRQVFDPAFPQLSGAQWAAALDQVQPPLLIPPDQPAQLTHEGLAALTAHLALVAAEAPAPLPPPTPARRSPAPAGGEPPAAGKEKKQTYALAPDLIAQLANVSYWCRIPISQLVVRAVRQLLAQYPEARRPRPDPDPPAPAA